MLGQPRATQRYQSKRQTLDAELLTEMRSIAEKRPCWGSPQVYEALRRQGREVNHKRVERLWREHGMQVPKKRHKRLRLSLSGSENSCVRACTGSRAGAVTLKPRQRHATPAKSRKIERAGRMMGILTQVDSGVGWCSPLSS
ncbi:hypothetical protein Pla111_11990 [Botrimarina hoheduenensis]|uniref:HTH-like domain-containing protein n=1 Tax=Botrimarina hoheduenensis TaxID=2528000 RepID=A0A5C5WAJ0_9BACT|nr:hypothetical protein Pla111_11990 [Botrimarina hoheduenensis]